MMRAFVNVMLATIVGLLAIPGASTRAVAAEDVVFAGQTMALLQHAVTEDVIVVQTASLRSMISNWDIVLLIVPGQQPMDHEFVRYCYPGRTTLDNQTTAPGDVARLREFATDTIFASLWGVRSAIPGTPEFVEAADRVIESLEDVPEDRRPAVENFVGAYLSDVPDLPEAVSHHVLAYRSRQEDALFQILEGEDLNLAEFQPYIFGGGNVNYANLTDIKSEDVDVIRVNDKTFKRGWLGSAMVVVPQGEAQDFEYDSGVPLGFQALNIEPTTSNMILRLPSDNPLSVPSVADGPSYDRPGRRPPSPFDTPNPFIP